MSEKEIKIQDAAEIILKEAGKPLHREEIVQKIYEKKLRSLPEDPEVFVDAVLTREIREKGDLSRFVKVREDVFGLYGWKRDSRIPDFQSILLPLLQFSSDGKEHSLSEAYDELATVFNLSDEERKELLPSGRQATFNNRVGWARTYLQKAGLLDKPRRGHFRITDRGKQVLAQNLDKLDVRFLKQYPEFSEFHSGKSDEATGEEPVSDDIQSVTPEESLEQAHQRLRAGLASELLETVKNSSPSFFEKLVIDLLIKMGYGGSRKEAGQAVGKSGDGGIDGIIKEDRLGLDIIYIQAKRWDNTVGRPEIQKFAGALQGKRAKKGIFITTSSFSREALEYSSVIDTKIILIDGERLADLMIDNNVGVTPIASYEINRIDSDYFDEG